MHWQRQMAHALRFGPPATRDPSRVYAPVDLIARLLKISPSKVRQLLKEDPADIATAGGIERGPRRKISAHHLGFLLKEETLTAWAAKTLKERCLLFHRSFPEVHLSPSHLRRLYADHKIKRKVIVTKKVLRSHNKEKAESARLMMASQVGEALNSGKRIIFVDEVMFTTATNLTHAYSSRASNIVIPEKLASSPAIAMLGGILVEGGLEG